MLFSITYYEARQSATRMTTAAPLVTLVRL